MDEKQQLAEQFETHRTRLRAVAYRMLGSSSEADDAIQEAWIRLGRSAEAEIENLGGWLTTVVARVCLDMLRGRKSRGEEPLEAQPRAASSDGDPAGELELANSVGLALLVVLDTLEPPERVAFVLHDLFEVPFEDIAPIVGRNAAATRQLASRARRRVRGASATPDPDRHRQRTAVEAFLTAARGGDLAGLLAVLDPNVVLRTDGAAPGGAIELHGMAAIVARTAKAGARAAQPALIDGQIGVVIAPRGRLLMVLRFTMDGDKVIAIEGVADPAKLRELEVATLES